MRKATYCQFFLTLISINFITETVYAQTYQPTNRIPVVDNTLGTQVSGNGNNFDITGGLTKGQTLFHSFTDFSVPTNGQANFLNPAGNRDMITRVTGGLFSDINGTLNSNGANFFLINPNGIVFGSNAQLNVGRAFMASTANGIDLVDAGGRIITFGTNGVGDVPLLNVNSNVLFNPRQLIMGGSIPGGRGIGNYGTLQTTNPNQYIGLIARNVTIDGGRVIAPGGRVDLGGLNGAGTVTVNDKGFVFTSNNPRQGDVSLINGGAVTVRANQELGNVNTFFGNTNSQGSSINIIANNINLINNLSTANTVQSNLEAGLGENVATTAPAGDININAAGKVKLDYGGIYQTILAGAKGKIGDIKITANSLDLNNKSIISSITGGEGAAGNIIIDPIKDLNLTNQSSIRSDNFKNGNAGNIDIKSTGNINIIGTVDPQSPLLLNDGSYLSYISSNTYGKGDTGKITIDTTGDISLSNRGQIFSGIVGSTAEGNSKGLEIKNVRNLTLNNSTIQMDNSGGIGNAGSLSIKASGHIDIIGSDAQNPLFKNNPTSFIAGISSSNIGKGDTGKITLDTPGDITISNRGVIFSAIGAVTLQENQFKGTGNSQGIEIKNARNLTVNNRSFIASSTFGTGNAGNIDIKTTGNINITFSAAINSGTAGKGDAGKITLDTPGDITISNNSVISSEISGASQFQAFELKGEGNSQGIEIKNARNLTLTNLGIIRSDNAGGIGNAGNIGIAINGNINIIGTDNTQSPLFQNSGDQYLSGIFSNSSGEGKAANISVNGQKLNMINKSVISTFGNSVSGGDVNLTIRDQLLLRNNSRIATSSLSSQQNSNGGNIIINIPLIVATSDNNDITANAVQGKGGNIKIFSDGLFGIQKREKGQESPFTNDITASSDFNQQGTINIKTPSSDPGRDSTKLPNATTDASNQISQVCSASNRQNKLTVTGRGGLPPNANEPLTSDVVWQDARTASTQPTVSSTQTNLAKLLPPAVGWVIGAQGKVTLIAAGSEGLPTGNRVVCPALSNK
jgi:filamentous hemagglutinin family protein